MARWRARGAPGSALHCNQGQRAPWMDGTTFPSPGSTDGPPARRRRTPRCPFQPCGGAPCRRMREEGTPGSPVPGVATRPRRAMHTARAARKPAALPAPPRGRLRALSPRWQGPAPGARAAPSAPRSVVPIAGPRDEPLRADVQARVPGAPGPVRASPSPNPSTGHCRRRARARRASSPSADSGARWNAAAARAAPRRPPPRHPGPGPAPCSAPGSPPPRRRRRRLTACQAGPGSGVSRFFRVTIIRKFPRKACGRRNVAPAR